MTVAVAGFGGDAAGLYKRGLPQCMVPVPTVSPSSGRPRGS